MSARQVEHAKVSGTGPSRRSARLQGQHPASSGDPIHPSRAPFGRQIEAGAGTLPSKRPGLTRKTQPEADDEQTEQTTKATIHLASRGQVRGTGASLSRHAIAETTDWQRRRRRPQRTSTKACTADAEELGLVQKGANKASASASSESITGSTTTKTTSTTTSGFALLAHKNGILEPRLSKPPNNLEHIRKQLARSRKNASLPESVYERYVNKVEVAPNEATMVVEMSGKLLKEYDDKGYHRAFTGFPKDVDFNNGLSAPQPDFVEGLETQEHEPCPVDEHVSGAVLYKDDPYSVTLPHIAGEWKGRGKDMEEARLRNGYDGAALVYGRSQTLDTMGKPYLAARGGHAKVTTFTTDGTSLDFYAHHAASSDGGTLKYH
ncbi:hypothetical protein VM1G_11174 [Cytospora mali]|uniref:Uncharacterized protein n=1 Tax=Cytospora mali TaxID=578113 RepID=A0A194VJQ3_CYTMA|nr:hypothetical protein VM1G_11174 [Valsa mali]